ncbi:MAG: RNA polymerase sigma factor [Pirellulales bacterium]
MAAETRQIVARCLAGSSHAFTELIERYRHQVYSVCYRYLGQRQDAEDAQQETFLRVARSLACWNPAREFEPWLLAIAANRCRTMLAKRARVPHPADSLQDQPTGEVTLSRRAGLDEELQTALERLRPHYREAFLLFHRDQLAYEEIGQRLGRPVGTVKTWVHRARGEMMRYLVQRGVDGV